MRSWVTSVLSQCRTTSKAPESLFVGDGVSTDILLSLTMSLSTSRYPPPRLHVHVGHVVRDQAVLHDWMHVEAAALFPSCA
jgi:hypothetical protein